MRKNIHFEECLCRNVLSSGSITSYIGKIEEKTFTPNITWLKYARSPSAKSFRKTSGMKGKSRKFYIHREIVLLATLIRGDGRKRDVKNFLWNPVFPSDAEIFLYCCSNLKLPNPLPNRRTFVALRSPCGIYLYPKCEEKCFITMGSARGKCGLLPLYTNIIWKKGCLTHECRGSWFSFDFRWIESHRLDCGKMYVKPNKHVQQQ